jgi:hypothetical protein
MQDYIVLLVLTIALVIYFWIDKKNFKDFNEKDSYEKFNAVRVYFLLILIIILLALRIINSQT